MSILRTASAATALTREAARAASAAGNAALEEQLADLAVYLGDLRNQCAVLLDENLALKRARAAGGDVPAVRWAG